MGKIMLCGDTHFGHDNLLKPTYDNRPFDTVEDMNDHFVSEWNKAVGPNDVMLIMGDFFMRGTRLIDSIFPYLNGQCVLCRGNHDHNKQLKMLSKYSNFCWFKNIDFEYNGLHFWCSHKPDDTEYFGQVDWSDLNNVRIGAHWHSTAKGGAQYNLSITPWNNLHEHGGEQLTNEVFLPGLSYNVSLDVIGYKPIALDQICEEIVEKKKELASQGIV